MRAAGGGRALRRGIALGLTAGLVFVAVSACGSSSVKPTAATASVVSAPVRVAHTRLGAVGYRVVGSGPPLILIMGYGWTMEDWDPRLVHALAQHNRVVMFDNSGVGRTQQLPPPLTIDAMADQTSALIDTLGLGRPNVLGWSMGGMIAQALAVLHPAQVRRLVLCATYPGTGAAVVPSATARQASSDFPPTRSAPTTRSGQRFRNTRPPRRRRPARKGLSRSPMPTGGPAPTQPDARSPGSRCPRLSPTASPTSSSRPPMTTSSRTLSRGHDWCSTPMPGTRSCSRKERPSLPASSHS
jgi:pimeloyl-ACP methyl ester carboxylesterase